MVVKSTILNLLGKAKAINSKAAYFKEVWR
jgi:hypothetical protein